MQETPTPTHTQSKTTQKQNNPLIKKDEICFKGDG